MQKLIVKKHTLFSVGLFVNDQFVKGKPFWVDWTIFSPRDSNTVLCLAFNVKNATQS